MKGALACVLAVAMLHCLAPALDSPHIGGGEPSVAAQLPGGAPAEPGDSDVTKLSGMLLDLGTAIATPRAQWFVPQRQSGIGPGELHPPIIERPPIASPFLS